MVNIRSVNALSLTSFKISMCRRSETISYGTAFVYRHNMKWYWVTNWHNVTGRQPVTLNPKNKDALDLPDQLLVEILLDRDNQSSHNHKQKIEDEWYQHKIPLYEDMKEDIPEKPLWYEHPQHGRKVDVVVIPMEQSLPGNHCILPVNGRKDSGLKSFLPRAGMDVMVLGFPRGLTGGESFPIWKRASIASEPDFDIDDLPKFLIDTATREGMSGSPVYIYHNGSHENEDGQVFNGEVVQFIGVYSGRIPVEPDANKEVFTAQMKIECKSNEEVFAAQMGIVWKSSVINEIIQAQKIGISSFTIKSKQDR
jgi:hypothetical protein